MKGASRTVNGSVATMGWRRGYPLVSEGAQRVWGEGTVLSCFSLTRMVATQLCSFIRICRTA